jgi:RimJ/RimL family protein N-acetyltransferase
VGALPELSDRLVTLRPLVMADAPEHLAGEDEELWRWLSGRPATLESVEAWIGRNLSSWRTGGAVRNFGVWDRATGALAGNVEANLAARELRPGEANVAYAIFPPFRGRGYAARSVRLLTTYLREHTSTRTAVIRVAPDNEASLRVARAVGYREVGPVDEGAHVLVRFEHRLERRRPARRAPRRRAG